MSTNYYVSAGGYVSDLFPRHLFITLQGKQLQSHNYLNSGSIVTIFVRSLGGKGGYGQLLKDFGKETALSRNKKSCRDLSGRIVRDLDDIEDLRNWVRDNPARLQERRDQRINRLERAQIEPRHMMDSSHHIQQKDNISENQDSAFSAFRKRKVQEDEVTAEESTSKKKWYEKDEPIAVVEPVLDVKSPFQLRRHLHEETIKSELAKKHGKPSVKLNDLTKNKFQNKNGSAVTAPEHTHLQTEKHIWDDDYIETNDPDVLKQLAIAKREKDYQKNKEGETTSNVIATEPLTKVDFIDINLAEVKSLNQLEQLGLDHLKYLLQIRKLKCGGNLSERASRLFSIRSLNAEDYPKKIRAK